MGFVSNKEEEKYLGSDKGKREITDAIFKAFTSYYQPSKKENTPTPQPAVSPQPAQPTTPAAATPQTPAAADAKYTVQIFSSRHLLKANAPEFKGLKGCFHTQKGEWYKYMYGRFATEDEARAEARQLQQKFPGCFAVPIPK